MTYLLTLVFVPEKRSPTFMMFSDTFTFILTSALFLVVKVIPQK